MSLLFDAVSLRFSEIVAVKKFAQRMKGFVIAFYMGQLKKVKIFFSIFCRDKLGLKTPVLISLNISVKTFGSVALLARPARKTASFANRGETPEKVSTICLSSLPSWKFKWRRISSVSASSGDNCSGREGECNRIPEARCGSCSPKVTGASNCR